MAEVTIIVPIYKVEKYLRACFESLLKQTSNDYTVLAINDGSPDNCGDIIQEYVKKYPEKIAGIEKQNGGYGSVLQLGIREMKTPYFLVCDPDDTLEPEAVATLLELAKVSGADITVGAKLINREGTPVKEYDCSYNKEFATLKNNYVYNRGTEEFNNLFFINPSPHAKLYRKDIAKDIVFTERVGYTDNMLFYLSLLRSEKVIYTEKPLATYLIDRTGNTMTDVRVQAMNAQALVFKNIVNQASRMKDIPDIFWYRMFEAFKFMLYETRRMNCTVQEYEETLNYLGTFLAKLPEHKDAIKVFYKKYSKAAFLEKNRDGALMDPKRWESAYNSLVKKMTKEYASGK